MRRMLAVLVMCLAGLTGARDAVAATPPPLRCTVSSPAFANPLDPAPATRHDDAVVGLQAYQHHTWVGFATGMGADYGLVSWRAGSAPVVLAKYRYASRTGVRTVPYLGGTISAVGVTPSGAVVAGIQSTRSADVSFAYAWIHGHRHRFATAHGWWSVVPLTVTASGTTIGYGVYGSHDAPRFHVVSWRTPTSHWTSLITLPRDTSGVAADARGDVAWSRSQHKIHARLASGAMRILDGPETSGAVLSAGGTYIATDNGRVLRWDLSEHTSSSTIRPVVMTSAHSPDRVRAVSPTGAVVWGGAYRVYEVPGRPGVTIPGENRTTGPVGETITGQGGVAFTAKDRLVHFFRCR